MNKANVTVKTTRKDDCGFRIIEDGANEIWYTTFNALSPAPNPGDVVTFDYKEKISGGRTYHNIAEKTFSVGAGALNSSTPSGVKPAPTSYGRPTVGFPIPTDHGNRAINRQSAIAQSVNIMAQVYTETHLHKLYKDGAYTMRLIEIARDIEAFTTGDLDSAQVQEMLEEMNEESTS